jgi:hypothetical protein
LTLNEWTDAQGERRTGLNVAAFRCEKVPGIGRNRQRREPKIEISTPGYTGEPYRRQRPQVQGIDDFNDETPFGR